VSADGRAALQMSDAEVDEFLASGQRVQVATVDRKGGIDLVPMSYLFWDGCLALWTDPQSRKVRNLRRNPQVTCLVEAGESFEEFRAVQIRGWAEVIEDPEASRQAGELLFGRYQPPPLSDEARATAALMALQRVLVVVHPDRIVSWDHRKLAGAGHVDIGH